MSNFHDYNSNLKPFARKLRNNSTKAEIRIWCELLRGKNMLGYTFNRQRPIDKYIVDFYCRTLKLIIEIDGWSHSDPEIIAKDKIRQERLESLGYHFIRFTDVQIFHEIEWVEMQLKEKMQELGGIPAEEPLRENNPRSEDRPL